MGTLFQETPGVKTLVEYLIKQSGANPELAPLQGLLEASSAAKIGLVLTERLINIPSEVVPPMYKMLMEEISWAVEEKEPYSFSHYLILSKTYREVESNLEQEGTKLHRKKKKQKLAAIKGASSAVFFFHPEDEILQRHANFYGGFEYVNQQGEGQSDSKRAFQELGIRPQGHLILIEAERFEPAVKSVEQYFSQN